MSKDRGLSRRKVLSGIAMVGSIGAVSSVGTLGLYSNEALFTGNLLSVGKLDLEVCWGENGEACSPTSGPTSIDFGTLERGDSGVATIQCNLDDNPAWTWLRTNCPDRPCGLQDKVRVSLWYDLNCNGEIDADEEYVTVSLSESQRNEVEGQISAGFDLTNPVPIRRLELCDALTLLRYGTLLDPDLQNESPDPLQPEGWCCLGFDWTVVDYICEEDSFELEFEFYAEQWRHNLEPTNPWPDVEACTVDCTEECEDCAPKQDISFVAFCVEDGELTQGDVTLMPFYDIEDGVYKVQWWSDQPLEWVVLFYGSSDGKYFENFHVDGDTSGTVHVNSAIHTPSDEDYDSKLLWNGGRDTTDYGQCPKDPCPDVSGFNYGCGVRYNFENGDFDGEPASWDSVCGQSCPGENGGPPGNGGGGKP